MGQVEGGGDGTVAVVDVSAEVRRVAICSSLFYEDIDLLPHRESAWALLEERVRDTSTLCQDVINDSPEQVATALGGAAVVADGALTATYDFRLDG